VSVDKDVVGFVAAYCNPMCHCLERHLSALLDSELHTHTHAHTHPVTICCRNTDHVHVNGHERTILVILAKYCTRLPDNGSSVIQTCWSTFKHFIILIVSTCYIIVRNLDNKIFIC